MAKAKMRAGTCKCVKGNRKLCKLKTGKVKFRGKCK
jgi:hypothetical protein